MLPIQENILNFRDEAPEGPMFNEKLFLLIRSRDRYEILYIFSISLFAFENLSASSEPVTALAVRSSLFRHNLDLTWDTLEIQGSNLTLEPPPTIPLTWRQAKNIRSVLESEEVRTFLLSGYKNIYRVLNRPRPNQD